MTQRELHDAMAAAVAHHQAGRLAEAEPIYRRILLEHPNQPDALHLLGAIAGQSGRLEEGIDLIQRAIAAYPRQTVYICNLSEMYRRAGRHDDALSAAQDAIRVDSASPRAFILAGSALTHLRRFDEAVAAFRRAIALKPDSVDAHQHLGQTLTALNQYHDAAAAFRAAIALDPKSQDAYCGLGNALREMERTPEAVEAYSAALKINPHSAPALNGLGMTYGQAGDTDNAVATLRQAVEAQPDHAAAHKNLGVALAEKGQFDESLAEFQRALDLQPRMPEAHGNRALILLLKGDYDLGWREYEWRWRARLTLHSPPRHFDQPMWDGSPLEGKTILLHAEQGFGDTIQFVRYLPMVAERGGRTLLQCQVELFSLLRRAPGVSRIISIGNPLPPIDCHCPLMSLPLIFSTRVETIPAPRAYLSADPALAARWKSKLDALPPRPKIGIAWAGNPRNTLDRKRSIPFELLSPLWSTPGVQFISLQKGAPSTDAAAAGLIDWTADLKDFDETAALLCNLDLVITVDTAVAHLAGAMGKPTWLMIPFVPDWRWLIDREDSPWYSSVRIFRQKKAADWPQVIDRVSESLRQATLTAGHQPL